MELNRRAQEESVKYREQLIRELEEAKELTRREKEQEKELQTARRQELEAQVLFAFSDVLYPNVEGVAAVYLHKCYFWKMHRKVLLQRITGLLRGRFRTFLVPCGQISVCTARGFVL